MVWKPKNPRSVTVIKLTLWAGIVTWMLFFVVLGLVLAADTIQAQNWGENSIRVNVMVGMLAVLCIFAPALLCVAIARYVNKKIGRVR